MGLFKQKLKEFVNGLDDETSLGSLTDEDRERLKEAGLAAFDEYVTEVPGPNNFVKSKFRPGVEKALENAIADWL